MNKDEKSADYWLKKCEEHYDREEFQESLECAEKAVELEPNNANALAWRGRAKGALGKSEDAITDCNDALRLDPDNSVAYYARGRAKRNLGRNEEAIVDHDKAIKIKPNFAMAFYERGISKINLGRNEEAIIDSNKAIEIDPNNAYAFFIRAAANYILERFELAKVDFRSYLRLTPDDESDQKYISFVKKLLKEFEEATKSGRKVVPAKEEALLQLGDIADRIPEAVMFVDLVGSTDILSKFGVERSTHLFFHLKQMAEDIFENHGVEYVKGLGDGFMAVAKDCESIVNSAVDLLSELEATNKSEKLPHNLAIRIGIDSGQVTIDPHEDRFGECVVVASRLEAVKKEDFANLSCADDEFPKENRIFVSKRVYKQLDSNFQCGEIGMFEPKGFDVLYPVFCVDWKKRA